MSTRFADRYDAGRQLARLLHPLVRGAEPLVLALPHGATLVAAEVAAQLGAPLDVLLVHRVEVPGSPGLGMGYVASSGVRVLHPDLIARLGIPPFVVEGLIAGEMRRLARAERRYREGRAALELEHRTIILVDDGLTPSALLHGAARAVREQQPARLIIAVPMMSRFACQTTAHLATECVSVETPDQLGDVAGWYEDGQMVTDDAVCRALAVSMSHTETAPARLG